MKLPALALGFTLVELMVVIAVVAISLAIAVPNFAQFVDTNRFQSLSSALIADMANARAEAIRRGSYMGICASTDGSSCSGSGADWSRGWIVFVDINQDGTPVASAILQVQNLGGTAVASGTSGFRFVPSGEVRGLSSGGVRIGNSVAITLTNTTSNASKTISVAPYGLIRGN
ncbi:hypothetical protein DBR44_10525 [Aquitalea sp. FJL05]|uniref:GspH/FimT family pseudopilin n=1 Tax=Aquitalea TaxID=407217 RepID=UPI000F5A5501|nr:MULTISPECIES: GspH/FimT family pseudopilin [Aquitalea]RQO72874.1 hypothetical protein DBR44_10525 [Aquitalea sp. FJL05]